MYGVPVTYTVDHRRKWIRAQATGMVKLADLSAYIASRVRDGIYDYDQLVDISDAQLDVAAQEVLVLVRQARANLSDKPIPFTAIVAQAGSSTYGIARQLAALFGFDGAMVQIVESIEDGERWLDEARNAANRGSEPVN